MPTSKGIIHISLRFLSGYITQLATHMDEQSVFLAHFSQFGRAVLILGNRSRCDLQHLIYCARKLFPAWGSFRTIPLAHAQQEATRLAITLSRLPRSSKFPLNSRSTIESSVPFFPSDTTSIELSSLCILVDVS